MLNHFIKDRLELILESIEMIEARMQKINSSDKAEVIMVIDSLAIRLQPIGENVKKINSIDKNFFEVTIGVDVDPIIRFRDFISHHYEKTDVEIVLDICNQHIPALKEKILKGLK